MHLGSQSGLGPDRLDKFIYVHIHIYHSLFTFTVDSATRKDAITNDSVAAVRTALLTVAVAHAQMQSAGRGTAGRGRGAAGIAATAHAGLLWQQSRRGRGGR